MQQREWVEKPLLIVSVGQEYWWSRDILTLIGAHNEADHMVLFKDTPWQQTWEWTGGAWCGCYKFVRTG